MGVPRKRTSVVAGHVAALHTMAQGHHTHAVWWCLHPDCLFQPEPFADEAALKAHQQSHIDGGISLLCTQRSLQKESQELRCDSEGSLGNLSVAHKNTCTSPSSSAAAAQVRVSELEEELRRLRADMGRDKQEQDEARVHNPVLVPTRASSSTEDCSSAADVAFSKQESKSGSEAGTTAAAATEVRAEKVAAAQQATEEEAALNAAEEQPD